MTKFLFRTKQKKKEEKTFYTVRRHESQGKLTICHRLAKLSGSLISRGLDLHLIKRALSQRLAERSAPMSAQECASSGQQRRRAIAERNSGAARINYCQRRSYATAMFPRMSARQHKARSS